MPAKHHSSPSNHDTSWFAWMRHTYLKPPSKKNRPFTIFGFRLTKTQLLYTKVTLSLSSLFVLTFSILYFLPLVLKQLESPESTARAQESLQLPLVTPEPKPVTTLISKNLPSPYLTSAAVLAQDLTTGNLLYEKNIHRTLPPASTTKIMTALVATSYFKPTDVLTVPPEALVGGSTMNLIAGEQISFEALLYGMMLNSGNDAAYTMAANFPGGSPAFVIEVNNQAIKLGLTNTHFDNPAGFDSPTHYSSAFDLIQIAKTAIVHPKISQVMATKETIVTSADNTHNHHLKNLNRLLGQPGILGVKTGFTQKAGENFVGLIELNNHRVLTVVLNSSDRFGETQSLIDWIYQNYSWNTEYK